MTARLVIGVDGGQSSTRCLLGADDGRLLGWATGPPVRHGAAPGAADDLRAVVDQILADVTASAGAAPGDVVAAHLSLTSGLVVARAQAELRLPAATVTADSDAVGALATVTTGAGAVLAAGTGVVAMALGPDGQRVEVGGWGADLGDEGGAYWLGLRLLQAATHAADGRGPRSPLIDRVPGLLSEAGIVDAAELRELPGWIASGQLDRPAIARLAAAVAAAAAAGDPVGSRLADRAGAELARCGDALLRAAGFLPRPRRLVLAGGVLEAGGPVADSLARQLADAQPQVALIRPEAPPVVGAYLLGLRTAGSEADRLRRAAIESYDALMRDRRPMDEER
ncbi:N-acetylglucosamine kinase [Jiangella sp. DSM 45060]|uniref:N-acetylglucosamine kinase n=1 Tax=Jiangella sp. DSM 45060 TaxID=1798224 RepID=UPI00087BA338|nr:BadF/BadG/BcrA/BcrD ATPase family protein [Jiangella sp. DSM 45060]SDS34013.1 glucosamine kinase [Jiangella sp. DSM 45060]